VADGALPRRLTAEAVGTGLLVAVVVGSGIAAQRLSPDDVGLQLLENSIATGAALVALILAFGPVSGAHFNPVVTVADRALGGLSSADAVAYMAAQVAGGCVGAMVANAMFDLDLVTLSTHERSSGGLWLGEIVATFGLLTVILGVVRSDRPAAAPYAVGGYIAAAYWFTSSTSFANPAVTIARSLTDTFAGIAPSSVPPFVAAQLAGGAAALALARFLFPGVHADAVVVPIVPPPHPQPEALTHTWCGPPPRDHGALHRADRRGDDGGTMDADAWDARYAATERVWSVEPNMWLVEVVDGTVPGRALDVACGEGRNAVWLAEQGWRVTAVDFSAVALTRGRAASDAVEWIEADAVSWTPPPDAFDLVAVVYLHLEPGERRTVLAAATAALAPGGSIVVIGHDRRNLADGVGGPQDPEILLDPDEVAAELGGLERVRAGTVARPTAEGTALDSVVVARRPGPRDPRSVSAQVPDRQG
jgi:glycerol uptake facilitator-like aquaporin/SAM-dependent methyltransferase